MKFRIAGAIFLGLCAVRAGRADLTMRHTFTFKFGSFLPAQATDAIRQQLGSMMEGTTTQIKGDRVYTSMGHMFSVADYAKGEITLVDPETKRFATVPLAEYPAKLVAAQKLPPMPPAAQRIFDNMKLDVKTSKTGQTSVIHGIRAEEFLLAISMEVMAGMQFRSEIHTWAVAADELQRTPELRELGAYAGRPKGGLDPLEMMTKSMAGMPGMGEKLRGPMQEMMKAAGSAVIRMQVATYMPAMAAKLRREWRRAGHGVDDGAGGTFDGADSGLAVRDSGGISDGGNGRFAQRDVPLAPSGAAGWAEGGDSGRRGGARADDGTCSRTWCVLGGQTEVPAWGEGRQGG